MSEAHRRSVILTVLTMLVILLGPAALAAPTAEVYREGGTPYRKGTTQYSFIGFVHSQTLGFSSEHRYRMKISGTYDPSGGAGSVRGVYSEHTMHRSASSCGFNGVSVGPVGASWDCDNWAVEYWQKRSATKTSGSTYPSTWTKIVDPLPVPAPNALNVATRSCLDVNWFPNQCSGWGQMWASR